MTGLQKLFLLLIMSYLVVKGVLALLLYGVTRSVEEKGRQFHQKREELRDKAV